MDDAIQGALIRLWELYQRQPSMMVMGDGWWMKIGFRAAQSTLRRMISKRGLKTAKGVRRMEFNATSLESDRIDRDSLELVEIRHFRSERRTLRPEAEQIDHRSDTERLISGALQRLTPRQQETLRLILPLIAQGYTINEAARRAAIGKDRARYAWDAFQHVCEELCGQVRQQMKGKGARASAEELAQISKLAEQGLSCSAITERIGRCKGFVKENFERATGYRRGANNQRNLITPQRVDQIKVLHSQGLSMEAIAKTVGCSTGSVCAWLNR
jgi:transposase